MKDKHTVQSLQWEQDGEGRLRTAGWRRTTGKKQNSVSKEGIQGILQKGKGERLCTFLFSWHLLFSVIFVVSTHDS